MKRMFSVLCLLLVVSLLFTGCVQKKESGGAGDTAPSEEERKNALYVAYINYARSDLTEEQRNDLLSSIQNPNFICFEEDTIDMGSYQVVELDEWEHNCAYFRPKVFTLFGKEYSIRYSFLNGNRYHGMLYVYQNESLYPLPEACEKGIVTEEDLKVIDEKSGSLNLASETTI